MKRSASQFRTRSRPHPAARGFTLMELIVVLALMGIIATVSLPPVFNAMRKSPMRQAVSDLEEGCRRARMMAIMHARPAELVINAEEGTLVAQLVPEGALSPTGDTPAMTPVDLPDAVPVAAVPPFKARIPGNIGFKQLRINRHDLMDAAEAHVRFFPNGTCDEMIATLLSTENEERTMALEIATGRDTQDLPSRR